jgi:hypothetical protein
MSLQRTTRWGNKTGLPASGLLEVTLGERPLANSSRARVVMQPLAHRAMLLDALQYLDCLQQQLVLGHHGLQLLTAHPDVSQDRLG